MIDLKTVQPLDLDRFLARSIRNRIHLTGLEVEGGWTRNPRGYRVQRDGSLDRWHQPVDVSPEMKGEIASPPTSLKDIQAWLRLAYPTYVDPNYCGLHVHMSFKTAFAYQRLMCPEYPATVVEYVKRWATTNNLPKTHPMWERLAGNCRYCRLVFHADEQIYATAKDFNQERRGHRYTSVNYCWNRTRTLEHRLLTMMDTVDLAWDAVNTLYAVTNAFLVATAKREETYSATFETAEERTIIARQVIV